MKNIFYFCGNSILLLTTLLGVTLYVGLQTVVK
jgi:hypothetical protein